VFYLPYLLKEKSHANIGFYPEPYTKLALSAADRGQLNLIHNITAVQSNQAGLSRRMGVPLPVPCPKYSVQPIGAGAIQISCLYYHSFCRTDTLASAADSGYGKEIFSKRRQHF
jgi:hypothetical protein